MPAPPEDVETWDEEWQDVSADIGGRGAVYLAEDDEGVVGTVREDGCCAATSGTSPPPTSGRGRGNGGVLKQRSMRRCSPRAGRAARSRVTLDVLVANPQAVVVWQRLGFETEKHTMAAPLDVLEARLAARTCPVDRRALRADRRPDEGRAGGREVPAADRPLGVDQGLAARERLDAGRRRALRPRPEGAPPARPGRSRSRSARSSLTLGVEEGAVVRYILWDRGGVADEYASVPEYFGELPPGDVIALGANPTVAQRLTGADPARVRAVARTAASPAELPPPDELHAQLADARAGSGAGKAAARPETEGVGSGS